MKDQHKKITGYRDLTETEIHDMNTAKALAEQAGRLVESIMEHPEYDKRWASIGKTQLQQGFMAIVRSIARPGTF